MKPTHDCKDELKAAGSRVTSGRLALLQVLEHERKPLSVVELQKKLPSLNAVTLYRALEVLVEAGLARKGVGLDRTAHFEYAAKPHHHHLVCVDCGFNKACATC